MHKIFKNIFETIQFIKFLMDFYLRRPSPHLFNILEIQAFVRVHFISNKYHYYILLAMNKRSLVFNNKLLSPFIILDPTIKPKSWKEFANLLRKQGQYAMKFYQN
jgi:hypothetical protein